MKQLSTIAVFYLSIVVLFSTSSCRYSSEPSTVESRTGIKGMVTDTLGNALAKVHVYCLYYRRYIPNDNYKETSLKKVSGTGDFDFQLEQNFPNPFSNSTFVRFSLPDSAQVTFKINDKTGQIDIYEFSEVLSKGYYQHFLYNSVDSLKMQNGPYQYSLTAILKDGSIHTGKEEMFVISDAGKPNSISNSRGQYSFDYINAYVGDSLIQRGNNNYTSTIELTNNVNLLFEKDGYESKTINAELYPDLLLTRDIFLIRIE